jgi:dTDP-4-dehydrorhamnose reductase
MNSQDRIKIKRILITGTSGMLGKDIFYEFVKDDNIVFGVDLKVNPLLPIHLQKIGDLTDKEFVLSILKEVKPDIIIHCAAIVNLETCEKNKELADKIHVDATKLLAQYRPSSTKIIYISTDSVFDGIRGNYTETDQPNPLNYYAKSKLTGENVAKLNPNYIVVRTNIFGFNIPLRSSLAEWAIKSFKTNNKISGFEDVIFNAIYTKDLAVGLRQLVEGNFIGTINIASKGSISKYDFLKYLALKSSYNVANISKSSIKEMDFKINRPDNTTLNVNKAKEYCTIPSVHNSIDHFIDNLKKERI